MHASDALPSLDADAAAGAHHLLLDVREYQEWMAGHAPDATHVPMSELPHRLAELPAHGRIVCVCRSGNRSARVTAWLRAQGFDAVNLSGGMLQWSARGHAVTNHAGNPGVVI